MSEREPIKRDVIASTEELCPGITLLLSASNSISISRPTIRFLSPTRARLKSVLLLALFSLMTLQGWGDRATNSDAEVKAAYLFNFAKFIEWPSGAFPRSNSPVVIGVVDDPSFRQTVVELIGTNTANSRRVEIRQISASEGLKECHMVFIPKGNETLIPQILTSAKQEPILTVSDAERFASEGGMIGFTVVGSSLKLEINLPVSQEAKLKISSKLLALGKMVRTDQRKEGN